MTGKERIVRMFGSILLVTLVLILVFSCAKIRRQALPPSMVADSDYVGMETCALCHEQIVNDYQNAFHSRIRFSAEDHRAGNPSCESCHGPGGLHLEAGGGRGVHIVNPSETPGACFQCHPGIEAEFRLQYHHPLTEGRMNCTNCHDPHGENIFSPADRKMVREPNGVCRQCHRYQTRPHVFTHEALRDGCTTCHRPHGAINEKLLIERDNNLCLKCHAQIMPAGQIQIGAFDHTDLLSEGTCWSAGCHTAVHGSNINPHLRY